MKIVETTDPNPIVTAEAAKEHLRVTSSDEDYYIESLVLGATEVVEGMTGLKFGERTCEIYLDGWGSGDYVKLPVAPVQAITSIIYTDEDENDTTWTASYYRLDEHNGVPVVALSGDNDWPTATLRPVNPIKVTATVGYSDANVPQRARQAIMVLVGLWYENREAAGPVPLQQMPLGFQALIWNLKK